MNPAVQRAALRASTEARDKWWREHLANSGRCENCDDSGDVHFIDGEWRGICSCPAGDEIRKRIPAKETQ